LGFNGAVFRENSSESGADDLFSLPRMWGFPPSKDDDGARMAREAASFLAKNIAGSEPAVMF